MTGRLGRAVIADAGRAMPFLSMFSMLFQPGVLIRRDVGLEQFQIAFGGELDVLVRTFGEMQGFA